LPKIKNKNEWKWRKETSLVVVGGGGKPKQEEERRAIQPTVYVRARRNTGDEVTGLIIISLCCCSSLLPPSPFPSRRQMDRRCDLGDINLQGIIVYGRVDPWSQRGAKCQPINFQPEGRHSRRRAPFLYAGEVKTTARFYLRVDLPRWPAVLAWAAR